MKLNNKKPNDYCCHVYYSVTLVMHLYLVKFKHHFKTHQHNMAGLTSNMDRTTENELMSQIRAASRFLHDTGRSTNENFLKLSVF